MRSKSLVIGVSNAQLLQAVRELRLDMEIIGIDELSSIDSDKMIQIFKGRLPDPPWKVFITDPILKEFDKERQREQKTYYKSLDKSKGARWRK